jgi:hypothetical protein
LKLSDHFPNRIATILITPNLAPGGDHHPRLSNGLKYKPVVFRSDRVLNGVETLGSVETKPKTFAIMKPLYPHDNEKSRIRVKVGSRAVSIAPLGFAPIQVQNFGSRAGCNCVSAGSGIACQS